MEGHIWQRHRRGEGTLVAQSFCSEADPLRTRRETTLAIAFLVLLLLKSSCATFSTSPRFTKVTVRTDHIRIPEGGEISEIGELFGVPPAVLAAVNTLEPESYIPAGTVIAVPLYTELFPVWRYTEANRRATKNSIERYLHYAATTHVPHSTRLMWPIPGAPPGSAFGPRNGRFHHGVDIPAPTGTPIFAAHAGKVIFAGRQSGYGLLVKIVGHEVSSRYAHASRILVKPGMEVEQGELIAQVGATGNASGPHLHYEVRVPTRDLSLASVDPLLFHTSRWLLAQAGLAPLASEDSGTG